MGGKAVEPTIGKIETLIEGFFWVLPNLGIALIVFAIFLLAGWIAKLSIIHVSRLRDRADLGRLLGGFVKWAIILFGLLVVAAIIFPSVKPADLLATLGVGSVAIGFAFRDILQNWLSGLLILYRRPFRTGDQIKSGDFEGSVEHIEARATLIRTYDGQLVVIPNSDVYTRAVTVRTAFPRRRSEYDIGVSYDDDVETVCRVIVHALQAASGVAQDPAPEAIPWALDTSSVNIKIRWWSNSDRASVVKTQGEVIATVKQALNRAKIEMPFPTRVVLLRDLVEGAAPSSREGRPAEQRERAAP